MWFECFLLYVGDLVTHTGDKEIWSLSNRLPDTSERVGIDVTMHIYFKTLLLMDLCQIEHML